MQLFNSGIDEILRLSKKKKVQNIANNVNRYSWDINEHYMEGRYEEIKTNGLCLHQWDLGCSEDLKITTPESSNKYIYLIFLLNGTACNTYEKANKKNMETMFQCGSCNMLGYTGNHLVSTISCKRPFRLMEISLRKSFIEMISQYYPTTNIRLDQFFNCEEDSFFFAQKNIQISLPIRNLLNGFNQIQYMGDLSQMYLDAKVMECFSLFVNEMNQIDYLKNRNLIYKQREKIHQAKEILDEMYISPPSLHELALIVGTNVCTLKCGFKQLFNNTVFGYLFDYRMNIALQLLLDTNKPIQEIGREIGYENPTHFSSAFKRKYGNSPSYYRGLMK